MLESEPVYHENFQHWEKRLDFSTLQILNLWGVEAATLVSMSSHSFKSHRVLVIDLEYLEDYDRDYSPDEVLRLDEAASSFFSGLAPLQSVQFSVVPACENAFQTILWCHGKSLRTLSLVSPPGSYLPGPLMTVSRIRQIQAHCPNIRDLRPPVLRTHGNPEEATIYQALGVFTQLTYLVFQLLLTEPEHLNPPQIFSQEILIRAAVDESLNREIYTRITTTGARSQQCLRVKMSIKWIPQELTHIASVMARHWERTRPPRVGNYPADVKVDVKDIGAMVRDLQRCRRQTKLGPYEKVSREQPRAGRMIGRASP
ncbi:hypothetical protein BDV12DRAFT_172448 [Aspergillus spectabilis]